MPVILIRNLPGKLYNGLRGIVHHLERDKPPVINFAGRIVTLNRSTFEIYHPEERKVLASRKQYPLKLAYALTVHRAQGQTIRNVEIDCYSFFAAGQMGVALGRAVHSDGVRVLNYNSKAAHLQHPKSVYDFDLYTGVQFRDDLVCCKSSVQYNATDHMDFPTERGDADNKSSSKILMLPSLDVDVITNASKECPWTIEEYINDHENTSFLSKSVPAEVKEILKKHMQFLYDQVDRMMLKSPKCNDDFVSLFQNLNSFLTSDIHTASCLSLAFFAKAQKLSAKMAYWIVKKIIKELSRKITENQSKKLKQDEEAQTEIPMSAAGRAKIRYIAGACIHKILSRLRGIVVRSMGKENKNTKIQRRWNYRLHKLLKSLRISEEEAINATENPESLLEVEFRQGPSRGLIHMSDSVFSFFLDLHNCIQRFMTPKAFHLGGENVHLFIRGKLLEDDDIFLTWMDLFSVSDDDDDDTFSSMLIELFELVSEHFLRISIVEGLHTFKTEIPRKKKQALRSKLAAICDRKGYKVKTPESADQAVYICPVCQKECSEEPERSDEYSIGCDICNNWYHFRCVGLTGKEVFIQRGNSVWKCSSCKNRGKGKGKKPAR